jgi:regulator of nonsense transcripts 2
MRSQQQADREEQQRIKNLVLNYEASNEPEPTESEIYPLENENRQNFPLRNYKAATQEKRTPTSQRMDKAGANRSAFRSRKLQLSDVNW